MKNRLFLPLAAITVMACADPVAPEPVVPWTLPTAYTLVNLGTLGGTTASALGINNSGQIVGNSRLTSNARPLVAFKWEDGAMTSLGSLEGSTFSRAFRDQQCGDSRGRSLLCTPERGLPRRCLDEWSHYRPLHPWQREESCGQLDQ
ncbi:MAG: hypothetical protein H0X65_00855 [Gemmatimonadetes bacterium]|nr:hypothetical protein [Gemmatimonadota bacterium]